MKKVKEVIGTFMNKELNEVVVPRIKSLPVSEEIKVVMINDCKHKAQQFVNGDFNIMKSDDGISWTVIQGLEDDPAYNDKIANADVVRYEKAIGVFDSIYGNILKLLLENGSTLYFTAGGDTSILTTSLEEVYYKPITTFK